MDYQQKSQSEKDSSNQGYSSESPDEQKKNAERILEKEISLQEYETDRDAILLAIQTSLKERQYDEAQEFIYKYRAAAKTDEKFAVLAKLVKQGIENNQKIAKIVAVLDATPEDDYDVRMALCQKILKIQPGYEEYLNEMNRCRQAKGLDPVDATGRAPLVPQKVQTGIKQGVTVSAFGALAVLNIIELIIFGAVLRMGIPALAIIVELAIHGITLLPKQVSEKPAGEVVSKIGINAILWIGVLVLSLVMITMR